MNRLTTNKDVSEMGMFELAHNSCYSKDGKARYRDFETNIDARELTRKLLVNHAEEDDAFTCDEDFDDFMLDCLQYGTDDMLGLIALFYRNLWAMADLYERLKKYEDLEEQGKLLKLPCAVGDTVYLRTACESIYEILDVETGLVECPFEYDCEFEKCNSDNERIFETTIESIFNNGHGWYCSLKHLCIDISIRDFGKIVFLTKSETEKAIYEAVVKKGSEI